MNIPSFGVDFVLGRPGAGKSHFGTKLVARTILEDRRPVYTNLPIIPRKFRKYLATVGGADFERLFIPLTEDHFRAFLDRAVARAEHKRRFEENARASKARLRPGACEADFIEQHGIDVYFAGQSDANGQAPNAIAPCSMIIIDEVQNWFPQLKQNQEEQILPLLRYLSMHRHYMHKLVVMTQQEMTVNHVFRKYIENFVEITPFKHEKVLWALTPHMVGLKGNCVRHYSPEQWDAMKGTEAAQPFTRQFVFFQMPQQRIWFRLYQSFTHIGSPSALLRQQEKVRMALGLSADGEVYEPTYADNLRSRLRANWLYGAAFVFLGMLLSKVFTPPPPPPVVVPPKWFDGITFQAVKRGELVFSDKRLKKGEVQNVKEFNDSLYGADEEPAYYCGRAGSVAVFNHNGSLWLWTRSEASPRRVDQSNPSDRRIIASALRRSRSSGHDFTSGPAASGVVGSGLGTNSPR